MKKLLLSIFCLVSLTFSSCNYLDMVPEKDILTIEAFFEQRASVEQYWITLRGEYNQAIGEITTNPAFFGSDEYIASSLLFRRDQGLPALQIASGQQMSQEPYCPMWRQMYMFIRNCNIFLENIHRTYNLTDEDREWWIADVKTLKAQIFFELMRHYGPIILPDKAVPVDLPIEDYQLPRQPVDVCFKYIVDLLDEAEPDIPMYKDRNPVFVFTMSKEALYALKAKVLLYQASPLFNGNIFYSDFVNRDGVHLFSQSYDKEKWHKAALAADKAVEICALGDRKLNHADGSKKTTLLNYMADIESSVNSVFDNPEFLLEAKSGTTFNSFILPRLEGDQVNFNNFAKGCLSPSMKMVEMYYTVNGLPIKDDLYWNTGYSNRHQIGSETSNYYDDVIALNESTANLHLKREPRFYASIAGDRMYFQRGTNTLTTNYNLLVKPYKGEVPWGTGEDFISSTLPQNITGYWLKKLLWSKHNTSNYTGALSRFETTAIIRLAELYLMQSEAWNEWLDVPDNRVYDPIDAVRKRAGIPSVRESWQNYSNNGGKVDTKIGMREIIRDEYNVEFAFEGHRYWNIRRWLIAHEQMNQKQKCWNVLGTNAMSFYNNGDGPSYEVSNYKFIAPRDYFAPIKAEQILISGMKQNPGW